MFCKCKFNPDRDIQETVVGLEIDLAEAIETGVVTGGGSQLEYDGVTELNEVGSRVADEFDALDRVRKLNNKASSSASTDNDNPD